MTIGNKIVETLSSNGVTFENKTIHTPSFSWVGTKQVASTASQHFVEWMGEGSFTFPFLSFQKLMSKRPFKAKCLN